MTRLTEAEIDERLPGLRGWEREGPSLRKEYGYGDFKASIAFVNRVADLANAADHHPDITIKYDRVTLTLTSHDSGGLTERDFKLAAAIDA
jgi:4a-hydroxytetrahydrobiopterin dehydratase